MKKKFKNLSLFFLIIIATLLAAIFPAWASQTDKGKEDSFAVEFSYGVNGIVNRSRRIPITATITNNGSDFEGRAILMTAPNDDYYSNYGENVAYITDILIPAGETREARFLLPTLSSHYKIALFIEDIKGNTIYTKEDFITVKSSDKIYTGLLSDDGDGLQFLNQKNFNFTAYSATTGFFLIPLAETDITNDFSAIDIMDILIITDYDTSRFSEEQYQALKIWIEKGGILLIGTGPTYHKTLSRFGDDYITGTIGSLERTEQAYYFAEEADTISLTIDTLDIQVDESRRLEDWSFQMLEKGEGKIVVFDFDLSSGDFSSWKYNGNYIQEVMNYFITESDWNHFFDDSETYNSSYWRIRYVISNTFFDTLPSVGKYVGVIMLYVALIPLIYLVLKKGDKRHLMWVSVPILSVAFGLFIYVLGSGTRQKDVFLNYAATIKLDGNGGLESTYFSTTSPKNKDYSFAVDGGYYVNTIDNYHYYSYQDDLIDKKYDIGINRNAVETSLEVKNVTSFQTKYFIGQRPVRLNEGMEISLGYGDNGLVGTVTNKTGYDLTDTGLILYRYSIPLGDIANGETVKIEDFSDKMVSGIYSSNVGEFMIKEQANMTIAESGLRSAKRSLLSEELDNYYYSNRTDKAFFAGFTMDYKPEIGISSGYDVSGYTLIMAYPEISYWQNGRLTIPDISGYMTVTEGDVEYYYTSDGPVFYGQSMQAYYSLDMDLVVEEIEIAYDLYSGVQDVYFYSNETKDFIKVLDGEVTMTDRLTGNLSEYFDDYGRLQIRIDNLDYDPDRYYYENYMPIISVSGRER